MWQALRGRYQILEARMIHHLAMILRFNSKAITRDIKDMNISKDTPFLTASSTSTGAEDCVLECYRKLRAKLGELIFEVGFLKDTGNRLIIVSDHGFCSFGEAKIQTI